MEQITLIYARNFTPEEMRQATAFYRTRWVRSFCRRCRLLPLESMAAGQAWGQKLGGEVQTRLLEELRNKGHNP